MKIGLVIQGPIIGGGLTGKTYGAGKTEASESNFLPFNALENILANLNSAAKFSHIVVSTWNSQPVESLFDSVSNSSRFSLIQSQDPTPAPRLIRKPVAGIPFLHEANKVRMFYSTRVGLEELLKHNIEFALKIRTDQTLNLDLLYDEFKNFLTEGNKKIFVPSLRQKSPWVVTDFYFGGEVELLSRICKFIENTQQEFHEDLHKDFFFKTHFLTTGMFNNYQWSDFLIDTNTDPISPNTDKIVRESIADIWAPGSQKLYESIVWRGEQIKYLQEDSFFKDTNRKFEFQYNVGLSYNNINFVKVLNVAFGSIPLSDLFRKLQIFLLRKKVRRIRNRISSYRDRLGLRF